MTALTRSCLDFLRSSEREHYAAINAAASASELGTDNFQSAPLTIVTIIAVTASPPASSPGWILRTSSHTFAATVGQVRTGRAAEG
jgi:hypothetical protein